MRGQVWAAAAMSVLALSGCGRDEPEPVPLVWCYETLADTACYAEPDQGRANRLIGVFPVPGLSAEVR